MDVNTSRLRPEGTFSPLRCQTGRGTLDRRLWSAGHLSVVNSKGRVRLRPAGVLLLLFASALWAEDAYVGAQVCGGCHPAQFRGQSASGHALALHRATEHPLASSFTPPEAFTRPPNFHIQFVRTSQGIEA